MATKVEKKPEVKIDGRKARSVETKAKISKAARDLIDKKERPPIATEVAAHAGVSVRTVYQHFDDVPDLIASALALSPKRKLVVTYLPKS